MKHNPDKFSKYANVLYVVIVAIVIVHMNSYWLNLDPFMNNIVFFSLVAVSFSVYFTVGLLSNDDD
jgi:hypothetical protein